MVHREQPCSQSTIITIFVINRVILNNVFTDSHKLHIKYSRDGAGRSYVLLCSPKMWYHCYKFCISELTLVNLRAWAQMNMSCHTDTLFKHTYCLVILNISVIGNMKKDLQNIPKVF